MTAKNSRPDVKPFLAFTFILVTASLGLAQAGPDSRVNQSPASIKPPTSAIQGTNVRTVSDGQKMKVEGVVVRRDADTFVVRDVNGVDTVVRLTDNTSVKSKGGFLRSGTN